MLSLKSCQEDERRRAQEEKDFRRGLRLSVTSDAAVTAALDAQRKLIDERLALSGLRAIDTPPYGDCQFLAVISTLQLDMDHVQLRNWVCDYIEGLPEFFGGFMLGQPLDEYVTDMRRAGHTWGDEITLVALAHILDARIDVVSPYLTILFFVCMGTSC